MKFGPALPALIAALLSVVAWLVHGRWDRSYPDGRAELTAVPEREPTLPGIPQSFQQDVALYPTFPWLVRRLGIPGGHMSEGVETGLGLFDPTNHIFTTFGACELRYSSLSASELWEPDATVARHFERWTSDGWYFVHDFPVIVEDDAGEPWLIVEDGTAVHWSGSPLRPHLFYPGELTFTAAGSTLTHADGTTLHFVPTGAPAPSITQVVDRIESRAATVRFVRDALGRVEKIVQRLKEPGPSGAHAATETAIVWDDTIGRPVRINYWQGPVGTGALSINVASAGEQPAMEEVAPVRCELQWGAAPRRKLSGTVFIDESPNFGADGSIAGPSRNEHVNTVYAYESGVDESSEKLKKILEYRGSTSRDADGRVVYEAAPDPPLIVATVYISHDGLLRGIKFADNRQVELFPGGGVGDAWVEVAEGWPTNRLIGNTNFSRNPVRRFHLRREGNNPGLNPSDELPMVVWQVEEAGRTRRRLERDPDHLRVTKVTHIQDPNDVVVGVEEILPTQDYPHLPARVRRGGITLFDNMTYDVYGRARGGQGRFGEQWTRSFFPPSSPVAGTVDRANVQMPSQSGGMINQTCENRMVAPTGTGLAGSDVALQSWANGTVAGDTVGLKSTGRVVGARNARGSGVHFVAENEYRAVTSVQAFYAGAPPTATSALQNVSYPNQHPSIVSLTSDLHGHRQGPVRMRDGVVTQETLDKNGAVVSEVRITLGRRGEVQRIETTGVGMHPVVEEREYSMCNQLTRTVLNGREVLRQQPRYGCQLLGETSAEACTVPMEQRRCSNAYVADFGYLARWQSWCDTACACKTQYICDNPTGFCTSSPYGAGVSEWSPYGRGTETWCQ